MSFKSFFSPLAVCILLQIFGCASSKQTTPVVRLATLEKSTIAVGSGGGFSGLYTGYVITRSGDIYGWRNITGNPDSLELKLHTSADSVNFFFRYLDEIGFGDIALHTSGNMNSSIVRTEGTAEHRIQWALDGSISAPPEISTFNSLVNNFIRRRIPKQ
ncbi:MAG: hypothetical protein ABI778_11230 [Ignavibacteriota bacterium]